MATSRIERLTNLVICLLYTQRPLDRDYIRANVFGYDPNSDDEAFERMFERDKADLRELGVPIEVAPVSRINSAVGYRIALDEYALGDIDLDPEEATAVAVASALWQSPELSAAAQSAVQKLRAGGMDVDGPGAGVTPGIAPDRGAEGALLAMLEGVDRRRQVTFEHRANPAQPYVDRTLHPWGVVTFRGSAYAVGHDVTRDAVRTFKLSRVRGGAVTSDPATVRPPDGFDLHAHVVATVAERDPIGTARLWVAQGRGDGLRRLASAQADSDFRGRPGTELTVEMRSVDAVAREVSGLGPDAVVYEPQQLRDAVVDRLTALAGER
ncbi:WYL domain-containing protein [Tsukamurella asaccharolytica]|uniref:WYL domain-containing protein n=1 Tax=Tsukamurella asaccharolytica TaxID=2592067 RepID=A0A5C5RAX5_9ACTN|nr:WYL domain-containing protein [Tsukamurella asaccharolytica]TWS19866.1 WYL domain-containing protein [Tsukamurella asaccharolytica]